MFLKKSLLFMTALALLMFAGQASAQLSLSLSEGGSTTVSGAGTEISVDVSQMGVTQSVNAIQIVFDIDTDVVTLTGAGPFIISGGNTASLLSLTPAPVPPGASFTFTTAKDVTGVEFSIGISSISLDDVPLPVPLPAAISFNGLEAALTSDGEVNDDGELVVNVSVPGLTAKTSGAEIMFMVSDGAATIKSVTPTGRLSPDGVQGMGFVLLIIPPDVLMDGNYCSVTFDVDPNATEFTIGVASLTVFTADGMKRAVGGGEALTVTQFAPFLEASATEVTVPHGETATATVTAMDTQGEAVEFTVDPADAGTVSDDGNSVTLSATGDATVTVSAMAGGVAMGPVTVVFSKPPPELQTESTEVTFDDFGAEASVSVMAVGFDEGAVIKFSYEATADFQAMEDGASLMITTASAGTVTVTATDGTDSASLMITFSDPAPYLTASATDVIIPEGGEMSVTVSATGLEGVITYMISKTEGTASIASDTDGDMVTITASGEGSAMVSVTASAGGMTTEAVDILFRAMPTVGSDATAVTVPQATVPSGMSMVVATGFPEGAEIMFNVEMTSGSASDLTKSVDGNVLTLTATGSVSVSVTASGAGVTTSAVEVVFTQDTPAAPASVAVEDQAGDNGYYVMVSFANSANHGDVSQYRVYREMMVTTTMDADGNVVVSDTPMAAWVPWAVVDAMDNDGMTRAVVPVTDAMATRWGVAAESGMDSAEEMITPAGKRVFSKESVQQLAQFLGLDPNRLVNEDELAQMFMPSADYINSIIGGRKNVVFAALDPDLSVLIGSAVVPQNIRTDGHLSPILSSTITAADGMVAAIDDTAPAAVTDVAADAETGMVTWTMSADDMIVGMINYRGFSMPIPGVIGYVVRGGASPDAMIDIGAVPAGSSSFQVPQALIESLINQGVPAVLVDVVAMDGTNMTSIVPPLVVELIPTRKPFVDADGGPVYIVKLDRHGAMTPNVVDFEDFVAFTMAFNTDETHENWRVFVQADLNDDKMVNFDDFILFFGSYGKEAAGPAGKSLVTPMLGVNEAAELSLRLGSDRVVAGETMFVDVSLANVQALMGYGFVLNYDAEKFEFVEVMPAAEDLLVSSGGETPLLRGWSPEAGQVHVMNAIVNGSEVSGGGDIVRLVFRVLRDFEDNARFEIAEGLVFDPSQLANPLAGGVLDIQTTPTEFALLQNFPNPFNPDTTIGYELAESADVTLQIYNVVGQVVRTLIAAEPQSVGRYQVRWDGMDDRGTPVSSGIYFYQISAGKFQDVRKLMLLK